MRASIFEPARSSFHFRNHESFGGLCCAWGLRSDTQVVTGKGAADCNGLVVKQVRSAGVPWWEDVLADLKSEQHESITSFLVFANLTFA